jgi:1-acyl-sn-glycerol-3-phosphate acyltransferase
MGPLFPDDGPRGARIVRRVRGIALETSLLIIATVLLPLLLIVAATVDLVLWVRRRKPWVGVRLVLMGWWFLLGELQGVLGLLGIYVLTGGPFVRDSRRRRRGVYALRQYWCASHLGGARVLFGLRFEIEGLELAGPGPELVLIRHASILDNTLPDAVLGRAHKIGLRFVIKRELRMLPTIDIGGRWVPTIFVRRGAADTQGESDRTRALAEDLGSDEGLLIYPEGTRHTPEKLARAQEIIAERQPEVAPLANRLRNVLPPRLGGTLALLDAAAGVDVVVCGHVGLDGFEYVSDIWAGGLVGTTVRVRFWRHPAAEIPSEHTARIAWLYDCWQELDDWVGEQLAERG